MELVAVCIAFLLAALVVVTAARANQREDHLREEIKRWERYREAMERGRD